MLPVWRAACRHQMDEAELLFGQVSGYTAKAVSIAKLHVPGHSEPLGPGPATSHSSSPSPSTPRDTVMLLTLWRGHGLQGASIGCHRLPPASSLITWPRQVQCNYSHVTHPNKIPRAAHCVQPGRQLADMNARAPITPCYACHLGDPAPCCWMPFETTIVSYIL